MYVHPIPVLPLTPRRDRTRRWGNWLFLRTRCLCEGDDLIDGYCAHFNSHFLCSVKLQEVWSLKGFFSKIQSPQHSDLGFPASETERNELCYIEVSQFMIFTLAVQSKTLPFGSCSFSQFHFSESMVLILLQKSSYLGESSESVFCSHMVTCTHQKDHGFTITLHPIQGLLRFFELHFRNVALHILRLIHKYK